MKARPPRGADGAGAQESPLAKEYNYRLCFLAGHVDSSSGGVLGDGVNEVHCISRVT